MSEKQRRLAHFDVASSVFYVTQKRTSSPFAGSLVIFITAYCIGLRHEEALHAAQSTRVDQLAGLRNICIRSKSNVNAYGLKNA